MATLDFLKKSLRGPRNTAASASTKPLSDIQYSAGFDLLVQGPGWATYQDFIIPQLSQLLEPLVSSRPHISVLEIGPGAKSVLGHLPSRQQRGIGKYTAFEPNALRAAKLEEWFRSTSENGESLSLPCLQSPPDVRNAPFAVPQQWTRKASGTGTSDGSNEKFDVVLFCHSMYGMTPKRRYIEFALELLDVELSPDALVVVFHRDGVLDFDGLVCHQTACHPTGTIRVADEDEALDTLASFVAGFVMEDVESDTATKNEWREQCRSLGRREASHPGQLVFSSPEVMVAFKSNATTLPLLTCDVPMVRDHTVKNREAGLYRPAAVVRPTDVQQVQRCVEWAVANRLSLTVVGGGHGGQCLWSHVVAVDMRSFNQVHIVRVKENDQGLAPDSESERKTVIVAESGCTTGDIIRKAMAAGLTVPLGARPSVGAGLWLQGGIGHLARLHGLTCDAIIGVVFIGVDSGQIFYIGRVPIRHRPAGATRPKNEADLLWAMKGAGTNFGIVVSVTFKTYPAVTYAVRNWVISKIYDQQKLLGYFDRLVVQNTPQKCSVDAYLYWDEGKLHLGVTTFDTFEATEPAVDKRNPGNKFVKGLLGPEDSRKVVDSVGLFETEMYMSAMHGGHGAGKTSSFKRCIFLSGIGSASIAQILLSALETRPLPRCYVHLLQGGGAIRRVAAGATAFGCRLWDYACVITAVWPRDQDGTEAARTATQWVYDVADKLLRVGRGAYSADLGPDPRDAVLAARAFGPNRARLVRLKQKHDPLNVLAYACPLLKAPFCEPKLVVLVTGESGAGKDHCAHIMAATLTRKGLAARVVSISDSTKRDYSEATGADLSRLLEDRAYKEQHRAALTAFFREQVQTQYRLPERHFLRVVHDAAGVDVLFITGMRDKAPVARFSSLASGSRLLELRVTASSETRRARGACVDEQVDDGGRTQDTAQESDASKGLATPVALDYQPSLSLNNDSDEQESKSAIAKVAVEHLFPFFQWDLKRLADMVRLVPDFPRPHIDFRHVLGICQQPGGLKLSTALLRTHFAGDWAKVDALACCEVGGIVFASSLAKELALPLALIRKAGKLPPPTVSVAKPTSHISHPSGGGSKGEEEEMIEMDRDAIPGGGASVVVVDDVLATGETLCAVLRLLGEAGVRAEDVRVLVVAEFPAHAGREFLRGRGFGGVRVQSLLIFSGL